MNKIAQNKYLLLNERIIEANDTTGFVPPCRSKPEVFFPEDFFDPSQRRAVEYLAKKMCGRCLFENECLDYALTAREPFGIYGGMTARERADLNRRS